MPDTTIIAVCGRKQSGKSSLCAFIEAYMVANFYYRDIGNHVKPDFVQLPDGAIEWTWGNGKAGPHVPEFLVKTYNFSDALKEVCLNVLGLTPEQCYGTDEQKNSLTQMCWDRLPFTIRDANSKVPTAVDDYGCPVRQPRSGLMTGREVMQVFGTDVMRKMFYDNVWVNATLNRINRDKPTVALIADMRFRTELAAVYPAGAYVVRLERDLLHDTHASEIDFDGYDWSEHERALVVPESCGIQEKNALVIDWLKQNSTPLELTE